MALSPFLHPFAQPAKPASGFTTLVGGEGSVVWDDKGRRYIDAMASLWYCNAGHGEQRIIDAISAQLQSLATYNTFDPWTNEPTERLAAQIVEVAPMPGSRVFFTCSGSEAVDSALKLAHLTHFLEGHPERQLVASREQGYHGVAYGGTSAQGIPANKEGWGELVPGFVHLPTNDIEAASRAFAEHGDRIGTVIAEPVQGAGGVIPPAPGYLAGLRRLCDDHGTLLIMDEVICAWGRLGQWFGSQHYGVEPDLVTFAKGVTSGYVPLGGVVVGGRARAALESDPTYLLRHGHTYSGHPTCTAAGVATLELYKTDGLIERSVTVGKLLADGLGALADDGIIAGARGEGAVWAAELHEGVDSTAVRNRMLEAGVIARPLADAVAFCPPLVITEAEIARCIDALAGAVR
ncbi:MAG: aminotransferase class III-fold pyridoxal phosphate-dependent enzyme [Acidimicrobiia bacterium]|nr:aminotransferase class III-fold pyridoxal phosphate-dependent enzyme [Acidimicrobiia bacterium]